MSQTAAAARSTRPKTGKAMTSPRSGATVAVGGIEGNKGGAKGKSGRHPQAWGEFIAELRSKDERFRSAIRAAAYDPESKAFGHVLKLVRDYDPDAPEKKLAISGGTTNTLTIQLQHAPTVAAQKTLDIGSQSWSVVG